MKIVPAKNKDACPTAKAMDFVRQIARFQPIKYGDGSWTDDQAEDAIVTVNHLIRMAREIDATSVAAPKLLTLAEGIAAQDHMWFSKNPQLEALINGWIDTARAVVAAAKGRTDYGRGK